MSRHLISIALLSLITTVAWAEFSARQKEFIKEKDKDFAAVVQNTNEKCGIALKASIDWKSFQAEIDKYLDNKLGYHAMDSDYCPDVLFELRNAYCKDDDAKANVKRKVKTFVCKFGGKGKQKLVVRGGTVTYWVDWDVRASTYVRTQLGKSL